MTRPALKRPQELDDVSWSAQDRNGMDARLTLTDRNGRGTRVR
jgi:hypothetical protein